MASKIAIGVAAVLATVAITGCSSTAGSQPQAGTQPSSTAGDRPTGSSPSVTVTTPQTTSVGTASAQAAQSKPVSALLADKTAPVTTRNMPEADASWTSAVQKTMSDGKPIAQGATGVSVNLMALVDEAAKTSDLDALVKLCYFCSDPATKDALTQAMKQTDASGRTGFAQLAFLLEHTHPAQGNTESSSGDFPGFAAPRHTDLTSIDKGDMQALGVSSGNDYKGIRVQFMNVNDGPEPSDGWIGITTDS